MSAKLAHRADYTRDHRRRRRIFTPLVLDGRIACGFCSEQIEPGEEWDLGHSQDRRSSWPEHQRCNRATAKRRMRHSREW